MGLDATVPHPNRESSYEIERPPGAPPGEWTRKDRGTTGDRAWWRRVEPRLVKIYRFHDRHMRDGLIEQPAHSDWQDSVRRTGRTFYTNLLYHVVSRDLKRFPRFAVSGRRSPRGAR